MKIFADNHAFVCKIVTAEQNWQVIENNNLESDIKILADDLFQTNDLFEAELRQEKFWQNLFLVKNAQQSQYDLLINKKRDGEKIPDKTLCLADSGSKFHGQRNRNWVSLPGNIHLCVYLEPNQEIKHFAPAFNILAAVSVMQTIDCIENLKDKAMVKWVNDILIDNSKVCGFLAHTLTEGSKITGAVLGIGLNVESAPDVDATEFVPKSSSLNDKSNNQNQGNQSFIFFKLIEILAHNYQLLINNGYSELLEIYRQRSIIIGRDVIIKPDPIRADEKIIENIEGKVLSIGDNLELYLENRNEPIFSGRLILKD